MNAFFLRTSVLPASVISLATLLIGFCLSAQERPDVVRVLGGELSETIFDGTVTSHGIFVVGVTGSPDFPTRNGAQANFAGDPDGLGDIFVARLDSSTYEIIWSTFLGGTGTDVGNGIVVDEEGRATISGYTGSTDFPTMTPRQAQLGGATDGVIAQFDLQGQLLFSTYYGGTADDQFSHIARDATGNGFAVVGFSNSEDFPFPSENADSADTSCGCASGTGPDAIVLAFREDRSQRWGTYLGSTRGEDIAFGADMRNNRIYVAGRTNDPGFPDRGLFNNHNGNYDAFWTEFDVFSGVRENSRLRGGRGDDIALSVHGGFVVGRTTSTDFPVSPNALQPEYGGGESDGFIAHFSGRGFGSQSTYFGGSGADELTNVDAFLDPRGDVDRTLALVGTTTSNGFEPGQADSVEENTTEGTETGSMVVLIENFTGERDSVALRVTNFASWIDEDSTLDLEWGVWDLPEDETDMPAFLGGGATDDVELTGADSKQFDGVLVTGPRDLQADLEVELTSNPVNIQSSPNEEARNIATVNIINHGPDTAKNVTIEIELNAPILELSLLSEGPEAAPLNLLSPGTIPGPCQLEFVDPETGFSTLVPHTEDGAIPSIPFNKFRCGLGDIEPGRNNLKTLFVLTRVFEEVTDPETAPNSFEFDARASVSSTVPDPAAFNNIKRVQQTFERDQSTQNPIDFAVRVISPISRDLERPDAPSVGPDLVGFPLNSVFEIDYGLGFPNDEFDQEPPTVATLPDLKIEVAADGKANAILLSFGNAPVPPSAISSNGCFDSNNPFGCTLKVSELIQEHRPLILRVFQKFQAATPPVARVILEGDGDSRLTGNNVATTRSPQANVAVEVVSTKREGNRETHEYRIINHGPDTSNGFDLRLLVLTPGPGYQFDTAPEAAGLGAPIGCRLEIDSGRQRMYVCEIPPMSAGDEYLLQIQTLLPDSGPDTPGPGTQVSIDYSVVPLDPELPAELSEKQVFDPDLSNQTASISLPETATEMGVDLKITLVGHRFFFAGEDQVGVRAEYVVANLSSQDADEVTLQFDDFAAELETAVLPDRASIRRLPESSTSARQCEVSNGMLRCEIGDLSGQSSAFIILHTLTPLNRIADQVGPGVTVGHNGFDPILSNNRSEQYPFAGSAELVIKMEGHFLLPDAGGNESAYLLSVNVRNLSLLDSAKSVILDIIPPLGLSISPTLPHSILGLPTGASCDIIEGLGTLKCNIPEIAPLGEHTIKLLYAVSPESLQANGEFIGFIESPSEPIEHTSTGNRGSVNLGDTGDADIAITKLEGMIRPLGSDPGVLPIELGILWTTEIANLSLTPAEDVGIEFSTGLEHEELGAPSGRIESSDGATQQISSEEFQNRHIRLGTLAPGSRKTVLIEQSILSPNRSSVLGLAALASTSTAEPDLTNNLRRSLVPHVLLQTTPPDRLDNIERPDLQIVVPKQVDSVPIELEIRHKVEQSSEWFSHNPFGREGLLYQVLQESISPSENRFSVSGNDAIDNSVFGIARFDPALIRSMVEDSDSYAPAWTGRIDFPGLNPQR